LSARRQLNKPWFLRLALWSLPLPWISSELGWFVAEHGRQPWVVEGVLPTFMGTSSLTTGQLSLSLTGFIVFYSVLAVIEIYLMIKTVRTGPRVDVNQEVIHA
jgi:cytochrome d ubiquinol oxidase subunit I